MMFFFMPRLHTRGIQTLNRISRINVLLCIYLNPAHILKTHHLRDH